MCWADVKIEILLELLQQHLFGQTCPGVAASGLVFRGLMLCMRAKPAQPQFGSYRAEPQSSVGCRIQTLYV